jgi:hypothetical protein
LEKIGWTPKGGCVLYLISYNSLTSFYVGNRQKYLQDKINLLFGKPLVDKIINREEPRTMTCPMKRTTKPLPPEAEGNSLEKALADLGYWVKIKCP